jgi:ribosomal protein S18 acetylase RimI-like enzyme
MIEIRAASPGDADAIWAILEPVIRAGETYALDRAMPRDAALAYWLGDDRETLVACEAGAILGTYTLRPNQVGGGAHVANCAYMVASHAAGRGIGQTMAEDSFSRARQRGFAAMQFNFVVSSNAGAVALWQALGFAIVGRLPAAFEHPRLGLVDALVMHRFL